MGSQNSQVLIALGSNLGDRNSHLDFAELQIEHRCGKILRRSERHETAPVGNADQYFLNSVLILSTPMNPHVLMSELLNIEQEAGRRRTLHWGNRTLDCDILLWRNADGIMIASTEPQILIPHPRMLEREFVLMPASEIAGEWIHPTVGITMAEAWRQAKTRQSDSDHKSAAL